jgi:hypothetical protein
MNERMAELINQLSRLPRQPGDAMTVTSGDLEKFAELIVGECIGLCKDFRSTAAREFCELLREDIQEHFGLEVEE